MDVNLSPTPVNPEHARLDRERTDRQRRLPGFDQDAAAAARVLVIGAGGLGCPVVQALAAAGVGYLHIVDSDSVELSNIQRQPLFGVPDVGEPKAEVAARRALELCPSLTVETTIRPCGCVLDFGSFRRVGTGLCGGLYGYVCVEVSDCGCCAGCGFAAGVGHGFAFWRVGESF